jgi:hypothetical protein
VFPRGSDVIEFRIARNLGVSKLALFFDDHEQQPIIFAEFLSVA